MPLPINDNNPLLMWAAYIPGEEGKRMYLGDGSGHLRLFKTEVLINEYLDALMTKEKRSAVVVHSLQGQIVVPVEDDVQASMPVTTLACETLPPTAHELLLDAMERISKRGKRK